jgi:hypothetical protein
MPSVLRMSPVMDIVILMMAFQMVLGMRWAKGKPSTRNRGSATEATPLETLKRCVPWASRARLIVEWEEVRSSVSAPKVVCWRVGAAVEVVMVTRLGRVGRRDEEDMAG